MLNSSMNKTMSLSSSLLAGGINYGMAGYGYEVNKIGSMASYIKYISYGTFSRTAVNGTAEGTFSPFEMIAGTSLGREINPRMAVGTSINLLYSQLEVYSALGASVDFSGTYHNDDKGFLVTVLAKNIGYQFKSYVKGNKLEVLTVDNHTAAAYLQVCPDKNMPDQSLRIRSLQ